MVKTKSFFKTFSLGSPTLVLNALSVFEPVFNYYCRLLRSSMKFDVQPGRAKYLNVHNNYLLVNGTKLYELLDKIGPNFYSLLSHSTFMSFKNCIFYVGKGCKTRKYNHRDGSRGGDGGDAWRRSWTKMSQGRSQFI